MIRRLIRDLALEVELRVVPTVRDADGLALSSRNALLSPAERAQPRSLFRAPSQTRDRAAAVRARCAPSNGLEIDYVEIADFDATCSSPAPSRVGSTRLIDNVVLEGDDAMSIRPQQARARHPGAREAPDHRARRDEGAAAADRHGHRLRRTRAAGSRTRRAPISCSSATRRR